MAGAVRASEDGQLALLILFRISGDSAMFAVRSYVLYCLLYRRRLRARPWKCHCRIEKAEPLPFAQTIGVGRKLIHYPLAPAPRRRPLLSTMRDWPRLKILADDHCRCDACC
jgi:hypothetical protein